MRGRLDCLVSGVEHNPSPKATVRSTSTQGVAPCLPPNPSLVHGAGVGPYRRPWAGAFRDLSNRCQHLAFPRSLHQLFSRILPKFQEARGRSAGADGKFGTALQTGRALAVSPGGRPGKAGRKGRLRPPIPSIFSPSEPRNSLTTQGRRATLFSTRGFRFASRGLPADDPARRLAACRPRIEAARLPAVTKRPPATSSNQCPNGNGKEKP